MEILSSNVLMEAGGELAPHRCDKIPHQDFRQIVFAPHRCDADPWMG